MATKKEKNYSASIPDWVDGIIVQGVSKGASDIHFDPLNDKVLVRFRIDGILQTIETVATSFMEMIIARLKAMAQIDTIEKRKPQDGHILFQPDQNNEPIDLRLSIFPTALGEAAVLRILNRKEFLFEDLEKLGMDKDVAEKLRGVIQRPSGMVLVTGPGGSGKTSTLYTLLNLLNSAKQEHNIITLEDPIELLLPGIRQSQIRPEIGFTFAEGLRSILRQDPDVMMIGEIRDDETAEISVRAALMGALFLSTMHTINSVGTIVRFSELGLSRSLIASSLLAVAAQRLVRTICPKCKEEIIPDKKLIAASGINIDSGAKFFRGKGCDVCKNLGFSGRTAIFEIMFIGREIQEMIMAGASFTEIEAQAKKSGMKTLREVAMQKAAEGITTIEEAIRVTPL
jgi:type IV pilus assembly protein PilB